MSISCTCCAGAMRYLPCWQGAKRWNPEHPSHRSVQTPFQACCIAWLSATSCTLASGSMRTSSNHIPSNHNGVCHFISPLYIISITACGPIRPTLLAASLCHAHTTLLTLPKLDHNQPCCDLVCFMSYCNCPPPLSPPRPAPIRYTSPHSNPFHPAHHTTPYTSLPDPSLTPSHPTCPDLQARHCGALHELFGR